MISGLYPCRAFGLGVAQVFPFNHIPNSAKALTEHSPQS